MLKIKIFLSSLVIMAFLALPANAQPEQNTRYQQEDIVLPKQAMVERETTNTLIYTVIGVLVGFATSSGVGYFYYRHRHNGTENDHNVDLPTPVNVQGHDKLTNKHGDLQPPEIEKHGNEFM